MSDQLVLTRRRLLTLLGVGAAGAVLAPPGALRASVPPDGPDVPVPSTEPALFAPSTMPTVADRAASLDWDVEAIFRFVADDVDYQPYNGALRGATGTLWDKAGNSVDKALLLGALLTEAGVPWRFAIGALDADAQDALRSRPRRSAADEKRRIAEHVLPPDVAAAWSGHGPWRRDAAVDDLFRVVAERADATYDLLVDALTTAGAERPSRAETLPIEEVARHVWVQLADGPNWVDLDPTLAGAVAGEPLVAAADTPAEVPADLFHEVTLRLVAEVVIGGIPTMTEVVTHTMRAADVAGVPIYVVHAPATWLDVGGAVAGEQRYRPTIIAGDTLVHASAFVVLDKGAGALDALGTEATADGQTLSEWLEVDVVVPGVGVRSERRLVFDRLAAERRESGDLGLDDLPPIELTHVDDDIGDVYLPCASPFVVAVSGIRVGSDQLLASTVDRPLDEQLIATGPLGCPSMCEAAFLEAFDRLGGAPYPIEPTVSSIRTVLAPDDDRHIRTSVLVDVIHAQRQLESLAGDDRHDWHGVLVGALAHAAERAYSSGAGLEAPGGSVEDVSVGSIFERALDEGIDLVTLRPGDSLAGVDAQGSARDLIDRALEHGRWVIVPARRVSIGGQERLGWWEYDPANGTALDTLDTGGHATAAEWGALLIAVLLVGCILFSLGMQIHTLRAFGYTDWQSIGSQLRLGGGRGTCIGGAVSAPG